VWQTFADCCISDTLFASRFDVDEEVDFIDSLAAAGKLIAIGECGLDAYYTQDAAVLDEQERVLLRLMEVAQRHSLPLILHSRKAEARVFEMLQLHGIQKADFHCYCGKLKLAQRIAEAGERARCSFCIYGNTVRTAACHVARALVEAIAAIA
jgi:Tat protein secretion system quality control protein TatD with DNase activity